MRGTTDAKGIPKRFEDKRKSPSGEWRVASGEWQWGVLAVAKADDGGDA